MESKAGDIFNLLSRQVSLLGVLFSFIKSKDLVPRSKHHDTVMVSLGFYKCHIFCKMTSCKYNLDFTEQKLPLQRRTLFEILLCFLVTWCMGH